MESTTKSYTVPSHVPPELVVDIDVYDFPDPGPDGDPQSAWRQFKAAGPLAWSPYNGGHWVVTDGKDIFHCYQDYKVFSSSTVGIAVPEDDWMLPINADPPLHAGYRNNIMPFLNRAAVEGMQADIRKLTVNLIEGFRPRGECEFVAEFSMILPLTIFLNLVGLPLDNRLYLRGLIETFVSDPDTEVKIRAHRELHGYLEKWIQDRIDNPREDMLTAITRFEIEGRAYTRKEMLATLTLLLHGGLDTVTNMLGFITWHLARHPEQCVYIRDNWGKSFEISQELLRRFAVPNLCRQLACDHVHKGVTMKKGEIVMLPPSLFNMDETQISEPDEVDFTRKARHITFGAGPHTCAGALLARQEIEIFLEEWLNRIPEFSLDPDRPPKFWASPMNTMHELWLRWKA